MKKKRILSLVFCGCASISLVIVMAYLSNPKNNIGNGFLRELPSKKIVGIGFLPIGEKVHYFAGGDSAHVYLGNWAMPTELLRIALPEKKLDTLRLKSENLDGILEGAYTTIRKDSIYLMDGIGGTYLSGNLAEGVFSKRQRLPFFSAAVPLGYDHFILRIIRDSLVNSLVKIFPDSSGSPLILDGKANGMFATDGILSSTPDGSRIFYNYYYKNQFLCLDSNLKTIYTGKTIDTCATALVTAKFIKSDQSLRMAAPPRSVNQKVAVNDRWLFVQSAIKAENETAETLKELSVVDIYAVDNGTYKFSLYIPNFKEEKMRDFRVYGNYLVALYRHHIYFFRLTL